MALELLPYAIGTPGVSDALFERLPAEVVRLDALDPANAAFAIHLGRANAVAYGALAMPMWVELDCALLPSLYVGFAAPGPALPQALRRRLDVAPDEPLVPLSGFCAARTARDDTIVAFSLFSLVPGLGGRSKALGLLAHEADWQLGVAQYDSPALRTHLAFGLLEIVHAVVALHERAATTFVYRLAVPSDEDLAAFAFEGRRPAMPEPDADVRWVPIDAHVGRTIASLEGAAIAPPGNAVRDGVPSVCVTERRRTPTGSS